MLHRASVHKPDAAPNALSRIGRRFGSWPAIAFALLSLFFGSAIIIVNPRRRVRIFLAEKGFSIPLVTLDLGKGEQHSDAYRAINPRRVVPTLVLEDGTPIGEVPAICRYIEEAHPTPPLLGETAKEKALVAMWERRAELEGFAAVMEAILNAAPGLKSRAIAGPHDYEQIPESWQSAASSG